MLLAHADEVQQATITCFWRWRALLPVITMHASAMLHAIMDDA